jgi:hypothetical protein
MASAVPKSANNQEIVDYMETLSKQYFSKVFPDPTISIEAKPKCGKQGGHIVQIRPREVDSPNINIEVIYEYNSNKSLGFSLHPKTNLSKKVFHKKKDRKKRKLKKMN